MYHSEEYPIASISWTRCGFGLLLGTPGSNKEQSLQAAYHVFPTVFLWRGFGS
jgi:hypothetical protein